jgi:mono/diheme cytochrome c family protein
MIGLKQAGRDVGDRSSKNFPGLAWLAGAACALAALSVAAEAQEVHPGAETWTQAGCFACHGDLAEGGGDAANPDGPSLRRTRMEHDQLIEVIACGRANTQMPAFLEGAYTEHACFDAAVGEVPANILPAPQLSMEEVENLVGFLEEHVVGVTRISRENCAVFFGGNPNVPTCLQF